MADITPGIGTAKGIYELKTGYDPLTGSQVSRGQAAVGVGLSLLGPIAKGAKSVLGPLAKEATALLKGSSKVAQGAAETVTDFGKHLRNLKGEPPAGMFDPHAHHIIFKEGLGDAQKALAQEGHALLRRYGIDPIAGAENLVWAPMRVKGQHAIGALQHAVDQLKRVESAGGSRGDIVEMLEELGRIAAQRR